MARFAILKTIRPIGPFKKRAKGTYTNENSLFRYRQIMFGDRAYCYCQRKEGIQGIARRRFGLSACGIGCKVKTNLEIIASCFGLDDLCRVSRKKTGGSDSDA